MVTHLCGFIENAPFAEFGDICSAWAAPSRGLTKIPHYNNYLVKHLGTRVPAGRILPWI